MELEEEILEMAIPMRMRERPSKIRVAYRRFLAENTEFKLPVCPQEPSKGFLRQ